MSRAILGYLAENPNAEDTVEGVVEWWLLQQRIKYGISNAREALSDLVGRGLVLERKGPDKRSRYKMNAEKAKEIDRFLDGPKRQRKSRSRRGAKSYREDS